MRYNSPNGWMVDRVFESFANEDDNTITARLEMGMEEGQLDATKQITQAAKDLAEAMKSVARFSETYLDFVTKSAEIEKEVAKAKLDALQITERQQRSEEQLEQTRDRSRGKQQKDNQDQEEFKQRLSTQTSQSTQALIDRRKELERGIGNDPDRLFEMLRERGLTSESQAGGEATHKVTIGGKSFDASDLTNDATRSKVLDELAKQSGAESGNVGARATSIAMNVGNVLKATRSGAGVGETLGAGQGALENLSKSSSLAGLAEGATKILPYVGAAVAALDIGGKVFEQGREYRNMGLDARGGGLKQGIGYEAEIRSIALNPFISTEQARQVIMGGLNSGYSGKQLDNVTDFVVKNFKDMNLGIADSFKLIQTNAALGGESLNALSTNLENLKNSAQTSNVGFKQMQANFGQTSAVLANAGAGAATGNEATIASNTFQEKGLPQSLAGIGNQLISKATDSGAFLMRVAQKANQTLGGDVHQYTPQNVVSELSAKGQFTYMVLAVLTEIAQQAIQSASEQQPAGYLFMVLTNVYGFGLSRGQSDNLITALTGHDIVADAKTRQTQVSGMTGVDQVANAASASLAKGVSVTPNGGVSVPDAWIQAGKNVQSYDKQVKNWSGDKGTEAYLLQHLGKTGAALPELRKAIAATSSPIDFYDAHGHALDPEKIDFNDPNTAKMIQSGQIKVKDAASSGTGEKFSDYYSNLQKTLTAMKNDKQTVNVILSAKGDLGKHIDAIVQGTENTQQSLRGENGATMNSPATGNK